MTNLLMLMSANVGSVICNLLFRYLTYLPKADLAESLEHTSWLMGRLEVCVPSQVRNRMRLPYPLPLQNTVQRDCLPGRAKDNVQAVRIHESVWQRSWEWVTNRYTKLKKRSQQASEWDSISSGAPRTQPDASRSTALGHPHMDALD